MFNYITYHEAALERSHHDNTRHTILGVIFIYNVDKFMQFRTNCTLNYYQYTSVRSCYKTVKSAVFALISCHTRVTAQIY